MTIITLLALAFPSIAFAETHEVSPPIDGSDTEFAQVLANAATGDTIAMAAGSYGDIVIDGDRHLTFDAAGAAGPVIFTRVTVAGSGTEATLQGVQIQGGTVGVEVLSGAVNLDRVQVSQIGSDEVPGVAIVAQPGAVVNATDLMVSDIRSTRGAIIARQDSTVTIAGGILSNNIAKWDAGAVFIEGGTVRLADLMINGNQASRTGGAITAVGGAVEIDNVSFVSNSAQSGGALFAADTANVNMTDVSFSANRADHGGHVFVDGASVSGSRGKFTSGQARLGGAIAMDGGRFTFSNAQITHQTGVEQGAAAYVADGKFTLTHTVMYRNAAQIGGGVAQAGGIVLMRGIIAVSNRGEALASAAGEATFDQSLLYDNESTDGQVLGIELDGSVLTQPAGFVAPELGDFALSTASPGLDQGVGGAADLDGTPADMGMYGGPQAWQLPDADGDGYTRGRDCDDTNANINESVKDLWYDGIDSNCDRLDDFDQDGDGYSASPFNGDDCDDTDARTYPGAAETEADGFDSNCDGIEAPDQDGDGWGSDLDCDDDDADVSPDATEVWYDGIDSDCLGDSDYDRDGDGFESAAHGGEDCDDSDAFRSPGAAEITGDGIDQDCDGEDQQPERNEDETSSVQGEQAGDDSGRTADAFAAQDNNAMTTTSCSTTGGAGGAGGFALVAGLMALLGRRRD